MSPSNSLRSPAARTRRGDVEKKKPKPVWSNRGLIVTGVVCALFLLWGFLYQGPLESRKLYGDLLELAVAVAGTLWSLHGFRLRRREGETWRQGIAANLLTLSIAGYAAGMGIYDYFDLVLHENPFPSWADAAYLVGTTSMVAGILLLPSRPEPWVVRVRVLLDGLIVVAALVAFSWYFTLGPTILEGGDSLLGRVLGASYPMADIVMMCCLLTRSGAVADPVVRRVRMLVGVGVLTYVVSDSAYCYLTLQENYVVGRWYDTGWLVTNMVVAQATVLLRRYQSSKIEEPTSSSKFGDFQGRQTSLPRMLLPYVFVPAVGALLVYVYRSHSTGPLATGVYVGAAVLLALILVRQVLAIAENSYLYRYLQAAYRELEALATTDAMTGLANHRVFQERLRAELTAAEEAERAFTMFLVDVDRFKAYNDSFGHPAGDEALKTVARILRGSVRTTDLAARYGGEEFAVILPNTDLESAMIVAERIRQACESTTFAHRPVTLSIGMAGYSGTEGAGELIELADRALYAAKHGGRNRVAGPGTPLDDTLLRIVDGDALDDLGQAA